MQQELIAVTGAGGFIGGALIAEFRRQGYTNLRAIDIKPLDEWYLHFDDVENLSLDLNLKQNCDRAASGARQTYNPAANMSGMGFIENNKALCMLSVLINAHKLRAALQQGVWRFFYSSSASVYNGDRQRDGPNGTWDGGREKAPAAVCRKVIEAKLGGQHEICIWNQLVDIVEDIAGIKLKRAYDLAAPKGVAGRNSDNTLIQKYLNWEPTLPLRTQIERTYVWIHDQYVAREKGLVAVGVH